MKPGPKTIPRNMHLVIADKQTTKPGPGKDAPVEPHVVTPPSPDYLTEIEALEFDRIAKILCDMRVMTAADTDGLAIYASTFVRCRRLLREMRDEDDIIATPTGHKKPNPKLLLIEKAQLQMRLLLAEFGLTPSARARFNN